MRPDVFSLPARNGRPECEGRMPELPGEPRLQFSEGCRAYIGGAIRQKDFLAGWFLIVGQLSFPLFVVSRRTGTYTRAQAISGAASFLEAGASNTHENEYER